MQLTWLGAAGFRLDTSEGATLLIDPLISRPRQASPTLPIQLSDLTPVDEILLTNGRFDHAMDAAALSRQTGAIIHAPGQICRRLAERGVSRHSLEPITLRKPKTLGSLVWQAWPSPVNQLDSSPVLKALTTNPDLLADIRRLDREWPAGESVAYQLQGEELTLVHFGSAGWVEADIDGLRPDIALLPVECQPDQEAPVVRLAALLRPKVVIPHHWDDYYPPLSRMSDVKAFEAAVTGVVPGLTVRVPAIGRPVTVADLL